MAADGPQLCGSQPWWCWRLLLLACKSYATPTTTPTMTPTPTPSAPPASLTASNCWPWKPSVEMTKKRAREGGRAACSSIQQAGAKEPQQQMRPSSRLTTAAARDATSFILPNALPTATPFHSGTPGTISGSPNSSLAPTLAMIHIITNYSSYGLGMYFWTNHSPSLCRIISRDSSTTALKSL